MNKLIVARMYHFNSHAHNELDIKVIIRVAKANEAQTNYLNTYKQPMHVQHYLYT